MPDSAEVQLTLAGGVEALSSIGSVVESVRSLTSEVSELVAVLKRTGGGVSETGTVSGVNSSPLENGGRKREKTKNEQQLADNVAGAKKALEQSNKDSKKNSDDEVKAINQLGKELGKKVDGVARAAGGGGVDLDNGITGVLNSMFGDEKSGKSGFMGLVQKAFGGSGLSGSIFSLQDSLTKLSATSNGLSEGFLSTLGTLGKFAGVAGAAVGMIQMAAKGIDMYQDARDVSISQTGSDSDMTLGLREFAQSRSAALFSGLSEDEAVDIQSRLIAGRAAFGSDAYNEGFGFAQGARLNYTMDAGRATDLYVRAVMRGGMTVEQLNSSLEGLAKTARESDSTMAEMLDAFDSFSSSMESKYGAMGTAMAAQTTDMFGSSESMGFVGGLMGQVDMLSNPYAGEVMNQYLQQGYEYGDAMAMMSIDMLTMPGFYNFRGQEYLYMPLGDGYGSFSEYLMRGDFDGLREALNALYENPQSFFNWPMLLQVLSGAGVQVSIDSKPDDVVGMLEEVYRGRDSATTQSQIGSTGASSYRAGLEAGDISRFAGGNPYVEQGLLASAGMSTGGANTGNTTDIVRTMLNAGVLSESQLRNMDQESVDALARAQYDAYQDFGGGANFESYVKSNADSVSAFNRQISSMYSSGMTDDQLSKIKIEIGYSDQFGQYIEYAHKEFLTQEGRDRGED